MVEMKFTATSLSRIELKGESDTQYYNSCIDEQWQEVKTILKEFGITLLSNHTVKFEDDKYKIQAVPQHFGALNIRTFYNDSVIAEGSIEGCHIGDWEGRLTIYIDCLKSTYKTS